MKYFFLLFPLFLSCGFYTETNQILLLGLSKGRIVVSSKLYSEEIFVSGSQYLLTVDKGVKTYVTFYPDFFGRDSRYPSGAIVDLQTEFISLSRHLGLLTSECNYLNIEKINIDFDNVLNMKNLFMNAENPWVYLSEDVKLYLKGDIGISSVSKFKTTTIPALDTYFNWIPENRLFDSWYPSIQSFYLPSENCFFRLHIFEDCSYTGFVEVEKS